MILHCDVKTEIKDLHDKEFDDRIRTLMNWPSILSKCLKNGVGFFIPFSFWKSITEYAEELKIVLAIENKRIYLQNRLHLQSIDPSQT
jgi:hypothetical protein